MHSGAAEIAEELVEVPAHRIEVLISSISQSKYRKLHALESLRLIRFLQVLDPLVKLGSVIAGLALVVRGNTCHNQLRRVLAKFLGIKIFKVDDLDLVEGSNPRSLLFKQLGQFLGSATLATEIKRHFSGPVLRYFEVPECLLSVDRVYFLFISLTTALSLPLGRPRHPLLLQPLLNPNLVFIEFLRRNGRVAEAQGAESYEEEGGSEF